MPYTLTGGTLLGAIRKGDMIKGDSGWDLDVSAEDVPKILENHSLFEDVGLKINYPVIHTVVAMDRADTETRDESRHTMKVVDIAGGGYGDLFCYQRFSDGIMRQIVVEEGTYFNAKLSFPAWFFENPETATLRGRSFPVPAKPKLYLERVYGPNWHIPLARFGDKLPEGYNFADAHLDADIETSIKYALYQGKP